MRPRPKRRRAAGDRRCRDRCAGPAGRGPAQAAARRRSGIDDHRERDARRARRFRRPSRACLRDHPARDEWRARFRRRARRARSRCCKGLPATVLDEAAARIRLMPGARQLVATMRAAGARTALVSGGFTVFAERVAAELGFDRGRRQPARHCRRAASPARCASPIVTRETKRDTLLATGRGTWAFRWPRQWRSATAPTICRCSTAAGLGVAFHAKPAVAAAARWRLDHADLTGLLYAQGYRQEEIVEPLGRKSDGPSSGRGAARQSADRPGARPAAGSICGPAFLASSILLTTWPALLTSSCAASMITSPGLQPLFGRRAVLGDIDDDDPLRIVGEREFLLQIRGDVRQASGRASLTVAGVVLGGFFFGVSLAATCSVSSSLPTLTCSGVLLALAPDGHRHGLADRRLGDEPRQVPHVGHRLAVEAQDDVAGLDAGQSAPGRCR